MLLGKVEPQIAQGKKKGIFLFCSSGSVVKARSQEVAAVFRVCLECLVFSWLLVDEF